MKVAHLNIGHVSALPTSSALILGTFDGVHIGHQLLLDEAKKLADNVIVLLIYTNKMVTKEHQKTGVLTSLDDRINIFKDAGVCEVYLLNLGRDLLSLTPQDFIEKIIFPLHPSHVVIGSDFRFGQQASGTPLDLKKQQEFITNIVEPLVLDNEKISTKLIKEYLSSGNLPNARKILGRYYALTGLVTRGFGLGNQLGFPTANVSVDPAYFLPRHGVYFVRVHLKHETFFGMASLGYHPTVNEVNLPLLEVNIFDFTRDIYHEALTVEFLEYLRPEVKFTTLEALVLKINEDRAKCLALIEKGDF